MNAPPSAVARYRDDAPACTPIALCRSSCTYINMIKLRGFHGFKKGRSVLNNLLTVHNDWSLLLNNNIPVDVVYLDFEKAFDRVPIDRLLLKIEHIGVRGRLLEWIKVFLKSRYFSVRIGSCSSESHSVLSGVP
ncbi:uncharacterized protein LOC143915871 [Arctopsyche grandis]|uniref:uncharacterized protein LOC143915871 n=1 Tax=Arctopsyche grandis TaxID=121162 RepID=UPI00406D6BEA